tara:strand:- start:1377 stop:3233 length:1857 start_codon:yes stop_codon:yes gene_type:complete
MAKYLSPNFFLIIFFFSILRFIDADLVFKGSIFILISLFLIYLPQKKLNKLTISVISIFLLFFILLNEKKEITEISAPLKLDQTSSSIYEEFLGKKKFLFIKEFFINHSPHCFENKLNCFQNNKIEEVYISPDQLIFNIDKTISRKVNSIKFNSLANSRMSFINYESGNINRHNLYKLDTPFYVEYRNLEKIEAVCFKGVVFIEPINGKAFGKHHKKFTCLNERLKSITGFNLPDNNLEISSYDNSKLAYIDDLMFLIFLLLILLNLDKTNISQKQIKLFIPVVISTFIIFYISRFDNWFNVFNLYNFYFFGFEGGDGTTYINFTNILFNSLYTLNFSEFFRGGENTFYFTAGLRYFMIINQIISGDYYYFYFFILFFIPKVVNKFLVNQFGEKLGYIFTLSFCLLPLLHHLGFSYYQFIRHSYRLFPEPLGYMFFISALTIYFNSFEKNYLKMNFLFALSVFFRPNLILSVFFIMLIKTIQKRINIIEIKYLFPLFFISLIYLFPLFHNLYFGHSFTLFTEYGSKMLKLDNILSKDLEFYLDKILSINFIFLMLIFLPNLNSFLKIILITQYITIFWFDSNGRYYWIYWLVSLNLIVNTFELLNKDKWKFRKFFTSN